MTLLTDPATHTVQSPLTAAGNQITLTNRNGKPGSSSSMGQPPDQHHHADALLDQAGV